MSRDVLDEPEEEDEEEGQGDQVRDKPEDDQDK